RLAGFKPDSWLCTRRLRLAIVAAGYRALSCSPPCGDLRPANSQNDRLRNTRFYGLMKRSRVIAGDVQFQFSISPLLPWAALGGDLWLHIARVAADSSGDQPRPSLECGEVPSPVHHHQQAVPEANQKVDVHEAP